MTISELGSLGEFVSSVAVLVTLVYLAIQVRLVRAESERAALVDRGRAIRESMAIVASDETLASGMMKATQTVGATFSPPLSELLEAGLSDLEAFRVQTVYGALAQSYMIEFVTMDEARRSILEGGVALNLGRGVGRLVWDGYYADVYREVSPAFADYVCGVIDAQDSTADGSPS